MTEDRKPPLPTPTRAAARALRSTGTNAERKLWHRLRAGRLNGFKFRRQHPVPPYIVDFYCEAAKLVVELDGSQHDEGSDRARTHTLERSGLKVLRFWDNEALQQTEAVLHAILSVARHRTLSPGPSPGGRGE